MPHSSLTAAHLKPTEHRDFSKRGVEDTYYAEMQRPQHALRSTIP